MLGRRRLVALLVSCAAAFALVAPSGTHAADCPDADTVPAAENLVAVGQATLCLFNAERAARGLPPLIRNAQLDSASVAYSLRMVGEAFFAHQSPDGGTLVQRLTTAAYLGKGDGWVVGENLAWGQGPLSTPRSIVAAWMNSQGHRENVLSTEYREIGLGIALGTPPNRSWGATYTNDFGARAAEATPERKGAPTAAHPRVAATTKAEAEAKAQAKAKWKAKIRRQAKARAQARAAKAMRLKAIQRLRAQHSRAARR